MTTASTMETRADRGAGTPQSQQVAWWPVHEFVNAVVAHANYGPLPVAGTPAWQQLADGDPRKLLACAAAGEHHVLRVEVAQQDRAEASKDVARVPDWKPLQRGRAYIPRRKDIA